MDLHLRQQFDTLLGTAGESFIERIVQRCAGQDQALALLTRDRNAEGVWLDEFVDALFADQCLDNAEGSAWVLTALQQRPIQVDRVEIRGASSPGATQVGHVLVSLAKAAFADLLYAKVLESMNRASVYG
ncbi:MAG: hypothetical protein U0R80_13180 [Nocardioidaceae bacterium]